MDRNYVAMFVQIFILEFNTQKRAITMEVCKIVSNIRKQTDACENITFASRSVINDFSAAILWINTDIFCVFCDNVKVNYYLTLKFILRFSVKLKISEQSKA